MQVVHCKQDLYTHYIGRPSILGNPYKVGMDGFLEQVLEKFEAYARRELMDEIAELPADAVLACWCKPKPCHGDVIVKLWNEIHSNG